MKAIVKHNGRQIGEVPLQYAGETSLFTGTYSPAEPGVYEFIVYAYDAATGNTGLDRVTAIVTR